MKDEASSLFERMKLVSTQELSEHTRHMAAIGTNHRPGSVKLPDLMAITDLRKSVESGLVCRDLRFDHISGNFVVSLVLMNVELKIVFSYGIHGWQVVWVGVT